MMYRTILATAAFAVTTSLGGATAVIDGTTLRVEVTAEDGTRSFSEVDGYAAALEALTGNTVSDFRKTGGGRLVVGDDLTSYRGDLHIDEGTYSFTVMGACGAYAYADEKGATYVADGATLDNALTSKNDSNASFRVLRFSGTGVDGNGALTASTVFDHASCTWSEYLVMEDDALISDLTCPNAKGCNLTLTTMFPKVSNLYSYIDMNSHKLTVKMKGNGAKYCLIKNEGRVLNPGDIELLGAVWYSRDYVTYNGSSENTVFAGPGSGIRFYNSRGRNPYHTLIYSNELSNVGFHSSGTDFGGVNRRAWYGPLQLKTTMPIFIESGSDLKFKNTLTGPGGLSVFSTSESSSGRRGALYLENTCDFTGDFVSTNTSVIFSNPDVTMTLGNAFFHSAGSVEGGNGSWKRKVVKTGEGALDYDSLIRAERLEIAGGDVVLGGTPSVKGLIVGRKFASAWNGLSEFFYDTTTVFTNAVQNGFNAANKWADSGWKHDEGEQYDSQVLVTYSGYFCNDSEESVRWSFLLCCVAKAHLIIDGTTRLLQDTTYREAEKTTLDLTPGWHRIVLKIYHPYSPNNFSPAGGPSSGCTNVVKAATESVGFRIDTNGRDTWTLSDYAVLTDSDGTLFRWTDADLGESNPVHPLTGSGIYDVFDGICAVPGTSLAFETPVERKLAAFAGFTAMTGQSDIILTGSWDIDAGMLKDIRDENDGWTTDGKVTFMDGAKIRITGVPHGKTASDPSELVILDAAGGIYGRYEVEMDEAVSERWSFSASNDGKRLLLTYKPKGLRVFVR